MARCGDSPFALLLFLLRWKIGHAWFSGAQLKEVKPSDVGGRRLRLVAFFVCIRGWFHHACGWFV